MKAVTNLMILFLFAFLCGYAIGEFYFGEEVLGLLYILGGLNVLILNSMGSLLQKLREIQNAN
jgi:hypothetical protein